jgi:hypothetical protein
MIYWVIDMVPALTVVAVTGGAVPAASVVADEMDEYAVMFGVMAESLARISKSYSVDVSSPEIVNCVDPCQAVSVVLSMRTWYCTGDEASLAVVAVIVVEDGPAAAGATAKVIGSGVGGSSSARPPAVRG